MNLNAHTSIENLIKIGNFLSIITKNKYYLNKVYIKFHIYAGYKHLNFVFALNFKITWVKSIKWKQNFNNKLKIFEKNDRYIKSSKRRFFLGIKF